ncbi:MAG: hypothetical protein WC974_05020 [Thermoplasmata archaeon]
MKREQAYVIISILILAIAISGVSQTVPWCRLDVNTNIGIFPVTVTADFYEGRFTYSGSSPVRNITIEGGSDFLNGTGSFDENMGRVQGGSSSTSYMLTYYNLNSTAEAKIEVKTHVSRIPWWVVGVKQKCEITVELNSSTNVSKIKIDKVYFKLFKGDESAVLWECSSGDELTLAGQNKTYATDLVLNEDYNNISIVGMADANMTDSFGQKNNPPPLSSFSRYSSTIQIKTISQLTAAKIVLIPFALPLSIIGMALCAVAIYFMCLQALQHAKSVQSSYKIPLIDFVDKNKKYILHITSSAAIISCLGVVFYILGITTIVELIGFADYMAWSAGLFVYVVSTCLLFAASGIIYIKKWQA